MTSDALERLRAMQAGDLPVVGGRTLSYVFDSGLAEADEVGRQALAMFSGSNGLDPTAFPSLLRMENELVGWAARLLRGDGAVGAVTSGGTESVLLAVQAARDARPDLDRPRMVLPTTAHPVFHKAAHYFRVEPVPVDVDPGTYRADPDAMADAIDDSCVLVVASAPSYPHGIVDPVPEIAAAAAARGVRCHVDACIGGWTLSYLRLAGRGVPAFDFTVDGVTSISVDLHKYGFTPKGASLLLHRTPELRRPQFFAGARWPGYTVANATMQSTKSGGPLAAAWAVVHTIGDDGYVRLVTAARDATSALVEAIDGESGGIDGLRVLGRPDASLLAAAADPDLDVFTVSDQLLEQHWYVQAQPGFRGVPASLHFSISPTTAPQLEDLLAALRDAVSAARTAGPVVVPDALRQALAGLDPATLDAAGFAELLTGAGLGSVLETGTLPERMAPVNALLDAAPPPVREALVITFLDLLLRP